MLYHVRYVCRLNFALLPRWLINSSSNCNSEHFALLHLSKRLHAPPFFNHFARIVLRVHVTLLQMTMDLQIPCTSECQTLEARPRWGNTAATSTKHTGHKPLPCATACCHTHTQDKHKGQQLRCHGMIAFATEASETMFRNVRGFFRQPGEFVGSARR